MTKDGGSGGGIRASNEAHGVYVGRPSPRLDQSDADQAGAEADRSASAEDEAASMADQMAASEDQLASDRDQAAADLQHDAAATVTPHEERAYVAARDQRLAVTRGRRQGRDRRERTAGLRRATAALRDRISRPRLRASAIRKRLIAEGETAEMAVRWCDAWEVEAARLGVAHHGDYWSRGTHWIWTQRAAGRRP
jgi:hypothetical protein